MIKETHFRTVELSDPLYEQGGVRLVTVKSAALRARGDVSVWAPQLSERGPQPIAALLILLHGVWGSHWVWSHKAHLPQTAQRLLAAGQIAPMVIAMPSDGLCRDGSAYLTHPHGQDVERWIVEEVPAIARLAVPSLDPAARISIAGLSMGGYGALRLGAKYPGQFHAIAAHSAITNIEGMQSFVEEPLDDYLVCAPREELSALYWLRKHRDRLPKLRFDCGLDDPLLESNRQLHAALRADEIPHQYEEFPGGHEWSYWQKHVETTLRFVNGREKPR